MLASIKRTAQRHSPKAETAGRDNSMRLLLAEDDKVLALFLRRGLENDGHCVSIADDGATALAAVVQEPSDLLILDLNLPVKDGEQVLDEVRALNPDLAVLILSARVDLETRVRCLNAGADDFLTKPFSITELCARVRALQRRRRDVRLLLRAADVELNRLDHTVLRGGATVDLTNKEFALLEHLMLNRGHCLSRVELLDSVWEMDPDQTTNIVDVYVNYLRRKLADSPPGKLIRTVRGQGYMIAAEGPTTVVPPHLNARQADQDDRIGLAAQLKSQ
jgi:DNA-binding response OmpR family regulator